MSLTRRLAVLLAVVLLPALAGSLWLHLQATPRNQEAAAALALALSTPGRVAGPAAPQPSAGDDGAGRLVAAATAQFELGHYRRLVLTGADGRVLFERSATEPASPVPQWFRELLALRAEAGQAVLRDAAGGTLGELRVAARFEWAERALWFGATRSAALLALTAAAAAALAAALIGLWRRTLATTVAQAQAIAQHRFVEAEEPRTPELRELTRAMNAMVRRLREQFDTQAEQVARLQRQAQTDAVSGLPVRAQVLGRLADLLADPAAPALALLLVRVPALARLNERHGRESTDSALAALGDVLMTYVERVPGAAAGRLNGTDFALVLPASGIARETAESVLAALAAAPTTRLTGAEYRIGGCDGLRGMGASAALAAADAALARAEAAGEPVVEDLPDVTAGGARAWRELLASALDQSRVRLGAFPVVDSRGRLIHLECPLRVQVQPDGEFLVARRWLALAARHRLMHQVDLSAVTLALAAIAQDGQPRCVHVATGSFRAPEFAAALQAQLGAARASAAKLAIEWTAWPEWNSGAPGADGAPAVPLALGAAGASLREALAAWQRLGATIGVEHAGGSPRALPALKDLGVAYVKVDARHVRGIADDAALEGYAASLVELIHGLGMLAYAEGVDDPRDLAALWRLGFDGATGAAVAAAPAPPSAG